MKLIVYFGVFATVLSYLAVEGLRRWAVARRVLDIPNHRSSHTQPTPRGGGLAIVALTVCGAIASLWFDSLPRDKVLWYLGGALLVAIISWCDDLWSMSAGLRLTIHSTAAILAIVGIGAMSTRTIPLFPDVLVVDWVGMALTFIWIVGLTNAYNFMDGIDGIAGLQAVVAGSFWVLVGWQSGLIFISLLGVCLVCSCIGFLWFNWPPAKIFMGDVGSAFLGYTFAVLPFLADEKKQSLSSVVLGVLVVWPFVFDTAFTFVRRATRREKLTESHRSHLYQRLTIAKWKVRNVSLLYGALAFMCGLAGVLWFRTAVNGWVLTAVLLGPGITLTGLVFYSERRVLETKSAVTSGTRDTMSNS